MSLGICIMHIPRLSDVLNCVRHGSKSASNSFASLAQPPLNTRIIPYKTYFVNDLGIGKMVQWNFSIHKHDKTTARQERRTCVGSTSATLTEYTAKAPQIPRPQAPPYGAPQTAGRRANYCRPCSLAAGCQLFPACWTRVLIRRAKLRIQPYAAARVGKP